MVSSITPGLRPGLASFFLVLSLPLSACVGGALNDGVGQDNAVEPAETEDTSWIPAGFTQISKNVAYRGVPAEQGPECAEGMDFCVNFEVATAQTCRVKLDIVTQDADMRIVEELWDVARVPVGSIGIIQFPIRDVNEIETIEVFDGECYFDLSG